ncbi:MAG: hypothetical protein EOM76_10365 [Sphingobacteriia bacterium]|nr:hypothetical protein [Sphingobacteriia bacterium]
MISKVIKCISMLLQQSYKHDIVINFQYDDQKELLQVEYGEGYHVEIVLIYYNWISDNGKVGDDILLKIYKAIESVKYS